LDAPACIDLVEDKVEITREGVRLLHTCKGKNKHFELDLKVLEDIDVDQTTWAMGSVGRGTLTLRKANPDIFWKRLFKNGDHRPRNMHTWWKMQEKYDADAKEMEKIKTKKEADATAQAKQEKLDSDAAAAAETAAESTESGSDKGKQTSEVVPDDPAVLLEKAKKKQRNFARKKAKSETKKLVKQGKRTVKQLESELATAKKEQQEKCAAAAKTLESAFKDKIKAAREATSSKVADVASRLEGALKHIDEYTHAENEGDGVGAFGSLISSVKSMLFGNSADAGESAEGGDSGVVEGGDGVVDGGGSVVEGDKNGEAKTEL
jgi:hypothetical protein